MFFKKKNDNNIDNNDKTQLILKMSKIITIITKKKNENLKTVLIKST